MPEQTTEESAGYDLYAADTITFFAPKFSNYSTQFKVGYSWWIFGQIMPRSSILVDHLVTVDGGVIDSDFRGIVKTILVNLSKRLLLLDLVIELLK